MSISLALVAIVAGVGIFFIIPATWLPILGSIASILSITYVLSVCKPS